MAEDKKPPATAAAAEPAFTPGTPVLVVDRWGKLHIMNAAIVTSTAQCDAGRYNVRIIYDHHTNLPDTPAGNLRVWKKGLTLLNGERYIIVRDPADWPIKEPGTETTVKPVAKPKK